MRELAEEQRRYILMKLEEISRAKTERDLQDLKRILSERKKLLKKTVCEAESETLAQKTRGWMEKHGRDIEIGRRHPMVEATLLDMSHARVKPEMAGNNQQTQDTRAHVDERATRAGGSADDGINW